MSFLTNLAKFNLRSKVYPPLTTKGALLDNDVLTEVDDNWTEAYDAFVALYRRTFKLDSATEDLAVITSEVTITETYVDEVNLNATDGSDLETITAGIGSEFDFILRNSTGGDVTIVNTGNIAYGGVLRNGEFIYLSLRGGAVTLNPIQQLITGLWERGTGLQSLQQVNTAAPNDASGAYAVAIGAATTASGDASHAQGFNTTASGESSHAQGSGTIASGDISHAQGSETIASGKSSHAQGVQTIASADASHAQGSGSTAYLYASHAHSSDAATIERQTLRVTCGIATTDDTPTNCIIAIGEDITLRTNRAYTMRIIGQATTAAGLVTSMSGECTATYDGADVVILDDTLAATYDGITIGGVQCVGGLVTDVFAIEVTGVAATAINWSFSVEWIEHLYA
jgi:hypothetical protein